MKQLKEASVLLRTVDCWMQWSLMQITSFKNWLSWKYQEPQAPSQERQLSSSWPLAPLGFQAQQPSYSFSSLSLVHWEARGKEEQSVLSKYSRGDDCLSPASVRDGWTTRLRRLRKLKLLSHWGRAEEGNCLSFKWELSELHHKQ